MVAAFLLPAPSSVALNASLHRRSFTVATTVAPYRSPFRSTWRSLLRWSSSSSATAGRSFSSFPRPWSFGFSFEMGCFDPVLVHREVSLSSVRPTHFTLSLPIPSLPPPQLRPVGCFFRPPRIVSPPFVANIYLGDGSWSSFSSSRDPR